MHNAKSICKDFETKNLSEYDALYVRSSTLLLADVFENVRNMCLKVCKLDPAHFVSSPELAWLASILKKDKSETRIID